MHDLEILPAGENDIREVAQRRWPDEASRRLYMNLAQTAPRGAWVARDEGTPIALGFARDLLDERFVSELYVEPSFRAMGIGGMLLTEIVRESNGSISALLRADDPAALALGIGRHLALRTPVLGISGAIPREDELARMAAGEYRFTAVPIDPNAHRYALEALDREVRGTSRQQDHVAFAELASGTAFVLNNECVGYAYVWPDGRIGPIAAASAAYLRQFFAYALAALTRTYRASWCAMLVPGENLRVMRVARAGGLTLGDVHIFASDQPILDLSRYVGFHPLLF